MPASILLQTGGTDYDYPTPGFQVVGDLHDAAPEASAIVFGAIPIEDIEGDLNTYTWTVKKAEFLAALDTLERHVSKGAVKTLWVYFCSFEDPQLKIHFENVRNYTGIAIEGVGYGFCSVEEGTCYLEKFTKEADGSVRIEQIDIRDRRTLETDNLGVIRIHRRSVKAGLLRELRSIRQFVSKYASEEIKCEVL